MLEWLTGRERAHLKIGDAVRVFGASVGYGPKGTDERNTSLIVLIRPPDYTWLAAGQTGATLIVSLVRLVQLGLDHATLH